MKYRKKNLFFIIFACSLSLHVSFSLSMAEDEEMLSQPAKETDVIPEQQEPAVFFETEGDFFLGYRFVSTEDSLKAAEYIYPQSSLSFGLNLVSCPLPFRYHVNTEFISKYDYYLDGGFAYKDLVLFRDILVGVHHNLEHYTFADYDQLDEINFTDRNPGDYYYKHFTSNLVTLRLKAPDFPLHTFINHRHVEREGTRQQRFLLGYFDDLNLISESRDIDWKSNAVTLGANSHLGPVEIEYDYGQSNFDPGSNNILYDPYPAGPASTPRPADIYPHNIIPETESSSHTIKAHSSYTGGVVAGATLSSVSQKNNYSSTDSKIWKGAFDFSWIPDPVIGVFLKYRHRDVDTDTPASVTLMGISDPNNPTILSYPVRRGISYDKDIFSLSSRYKPLQRLTLFAKYEYSQTDRTDVEEWELLTSQTKIHTIDLAADAKPIDRLKVKASYEYKNYDQPAYNTSPDNSNKLKLTTSYLPVAWLSFYLEYILHLTERDPLRYLNNDPAVLLETGERDSRYDQILASLTTTLSPKVSLTLSWFYQKMDVEQDLAYGKWADPPNTGQGDYPYRDIGVPYTDRANTFSATLQWLPREDFSLTTDLSYTIAKGSTAYTNVIDNTPLSFAPLSSLEATETSLTIDLAKKLPRDWEIGLRSYINIYNDKTTDFLDGEVYVTTFGIKRYF